MTYLARKRVGMIPQLSSRTPLAILAIFMVKTAMVKMRVKRSPCGSQPTEKKSERETMRERWRVSDGRTAQVRYGERAMQWNTSPL